MPGGRSRSAPLLGMSGVVMSFLEPGNDDSRLSKYLVQAGWKDVPHLDEEEKCILVANTPYQIKARTEGSRRWAWGPSTRSTNPRSQCQISPSWIRGQELSVWCRVEPDGGHLGAPETRAPGYLL
jgi:hypothetical protein